MDKKNIRKIMLWENSIIAALAISTGLFFGAVFSKLAETGLLNLLKLDVDYQLSVSGASIWKTAVLYLGIYFCLLFNSVLRVNKLNPLQLLQSNRVGEKPPKASRIVALLGVLLLGFAYYLAVSVETPLKAIVLFFFAVVMVIIATYLIFGVGSVVLCRVLQKNKNYYYRSNHFVSVSSMVYRMKRNGAGLASICILSTMVLVMVSGTTTLYIGAEDNLRTMYPYSLEIGVDFEKLEHFTEENFELLREVCKDIPTKYGESERKTLSTSGMLVDGNLITDSGNRMNIATVNSYDSLCEVIYYSLNDYNRLEGKTESLEEEECLIYCDGAELDFAQFTVDGEAPLNVKKVLEEFTLTDSAALASIVPCVYLVIEDLEGYAKPMLLKENVYGNPAFYLDWQYGFHTELSADENMDAMKEMKAALSEISSKGSIDMSYSLECQDYIRNEFFDMYGSLFFLGIVLSILFVFATVLIIYYKQISEGYEDRARFEIMQKVGMTKQEIKKSVNSQILTVFFLPLVFAGLHLSFAFPIVWRMLQLFSMRNLSLMIAVTIGCFLVFGVFYGVVYKVTAGAYYKIVSGME